MIYFDYAASGPMHSEVLDIVFKTQKENFSNPSSKHILGAELDEAIEEARAGFLKHLGGAPKDEFLFTSSATESNNTVIRGVELKAGDVVVYSRADHPSVTAPIEFLVEEKKIVLREILLEANGSINHEKFSALLDDKVKLVLLSHVNNQSGMICDVLALSKLVKEKTSAHVHVDAVQSFGKIPLKVSAHIDSMSVTSHKIGGPKGVAGLYLKSPYKIKPLLLGGGQEKGMRSGTQAYPLIAGFSLAAKISMKEREISFKKISPVSLMIETNLKEKIPGIIFPFTGEKSPYIISLVLPGVSSDIVLRHLEREKVYVSTTSACSSRVTGFNQSLASLNIPEKYHKNFLRISLGPNSKEEEALAFVEKFKKVWDSVCNHI